MWSVRRRPVRPRVATTCPNLATDRRLAEAEARLQQFQEHVRSLLALSLNATQFSVLRATDYFRFLPPAGLLPRGTSRDPGVLPGLFFSRQPHRAPEYIDDTVLPDVLDQSLAYDAIDLASGELIWLYETWQNALAVDRAAPVRPYLIFTTGHMPHRAVARFDLARWDYSHFNDAD
jgi:hypothetical protein